jgi:hypothetical protein
MEIPKGNTWKLAENRTLKWGSSPPPADMPTFKWLFLKNLGSKTLGQIQNFDPHRLMSRLKSKTTPGDTLRTRPYSYRRLDPKDGYRWCWRTTRIRTSWSERFSWREAAVARFCTTPGLGSITGSPVFLSRLNRRQFVNARDGEGAVADGKADAFDGTGADVAGGEDSEDRASQNKGRVYTKHKCPSRKRDSFVVHNTYVLCPYIDTALSF